MASASFPRASVATQAPEGAGAGVPTTWVEAPEYSLTSKWLQPRAFHFHTRKPHFDTRSVWMSASGCLQQSTAISLIPCELLLMPINCAVWPADL